MAICHFRYHQVTRTKGMSLMSHMAYIMRKKLTDARTGMTFDYTGKGAAEIMVFCPDNAPVWMKDVENVEKRVNFFERKEDEIIYKRYKDPAEKDKVLNSACMAQTFEFSLQNELTKEQNLEIVENYIEKNFTSRGLVVECAIHWENGQPHVHLGVYARGVKEGEALRKGKEFNRIDEELGIPLFSKQGLEYLRKSYVEETNLVLKKYGHEVQLDHRSYKDRGLDLVATKHVGVYASKYLRNGEVSEIASKNEDIRRENFIRMLNDPSVLVKKVAQERTVFTKSDLMAEIFKLVEGDDVSYVALSQKVTHYMDSSLPISFGKEVVGSNIKFESDDVLRQLERNAELFLAKVIGGDYSLVSAGQSIVGESVYTSRERMEYERDTEARIVRMSGRDLIGHLDEKVVNKQLSICAREDGFVHYSEEQLAAIGELTSGGQLQVLRGRAGTGKTTVLKPVVRAYEEVGYRVIGCSFQSRVQEQLQREVGMSSATIDALFKRWHEYDKLVSGGFSGQSGKYAQQKLARLEPWQLTSKSVLVVDEGAMVEFNKWSLLLKRAEAVGAKVIDLHDRKQIKPVYGQDISGLLEKHVRKDIELREIHRQRVGWMKEASALANDHRFSEALLMYDDHGLVKYENTFAELKESAFKHYMELSDGSNNDNYIITKRNEDNRELNGKIYDAFRKRGEFSNLTKIVITDYTTGQKQELEFGVGCKVILRQNDSNWHTSIVGDSKQDIAGIRDTFGNGVSNGSFGIIESIDSNKHVMQVRLRDDRLVEFDYTNYDKFNYGWSITPNNAQGMGAEKVLPLLRDTDSLGDVVVPLTRHKQYMKVFLAKEHFANIDAVDKVIRGDNVTLALDHIVSDDDKKYYDKIVRYNRVSTEIGNIYNQIEATALEYESLGKVYDKSLHPAWKDFNDKQRQQKDLALSILDKWVHCKEYASSSNISLRDLEVKAGVGERLFSAVERQAINVVDEYFRTSIAVSKLRKEMQVTHPSGLMEEHRDYSRYISLRNSRNAMAYGIKQNIGLYKPFFKLNYEFSNKKDKETNRKKIVSYNTAWARFEVRPPSIKSLMQHATIHAERNSSKYLIESLPAEKRVIYEDLLVYKDAMRTVACCYHGLSEIKSHENSNPTIATNGMVAKLEDIYKDACIRRDRVAYQIVERYTSGGSLDTSRFENVLSLVGDVDEGKLLTHAYQGNIRHLYNEYKLADSLENRLLLAERLYDLCLSKADSFNKAAYGVLRAEGCDVNRLRFENGYAKYLVAGNHEKKYRTVDELEQAYQDISAYNIKRDECSKQWFIIRSRAVEEIHQLQEEQLSNLQASGLAKDVRFADLRKEASVYESELDNKANNIDKDHAKKLRKPANINEIRYINERLQKFVSHDSAAIDLHEDVITNQRRLGELQHLATSSYRGFVNVHNNLTSDIGGEYSRWGDLYYRKSLLAHDLIKNHGDVIKHSFDGAYYNRLQKESNNYGNILDKELKIELDKILLENERKVREEELLKIRQAKISAARALYHKSIDISGTQAESYLQTKRSITVDSLGDNIRYVPAGTEFSYNGEDKKVYNGAMLCASIDVEGNVLGVQLTYLQDGAKQKRKDGTTLPKLKYGVSDGLVNVYGHDDGHDRDIDANRVALIAEGVETALSLKDAVISNNDQRQGLVDGGSLQQDQDLDQYLKHNVAIYAASGIGNLGEISARGYDRVVICADYDGVGAKTHEQTEKVAESLRLQNIDVEVIYPPADGNNPEKKIDFNDVLCEEGGIHKIQQAILPALERLTASVDKNSFKQFVEISDNVTDVTHTKDDQIAKTTELDINSTSHELRESTPISSREISGNDDNELAVKVNKYPSLHLDTAVSSSCILDIQVAEENEQKQLSLSSKNKEVDSDLDVNFTVKEKSDTINQELTNLREDVDSLIRGNIADSTLRSNGEDLAYDRGSSTFVQVVGDGEFDRTQTILSENQASNLDNATEHSKTITDSEALTLEQSGNNIIDSRPSDLELANELDITQLNLKNTKESTKLEVILRGSLEECKTDAEIDLLIEHDNKEAIAQHEQEVQKSLDELDLMEREYAERQAEEKKTKELGEYKQSLPYDISILYENISVSKERVSNKEVTGQDVLDYSVDCYKASQNEELMAAVEKLNPDLHESICESAGAGKEEYKKREKELQKSYDFGLGMKF